MTRILVIEDEEGIREEVAGILKFEGFSVLEAEDGAAGLALAQQHRPDLILSDIMMPKLDGYGVFLRLQDERPTAVIPFIFLTAKADKKDMRKGMGMGADDYLTKPFTRDELLQAVQSRISKRAVVEEEMSQDLDDLRYAIASHLPHELRTPLICILGYGAILEEDNTSLSAQEIAQMGRAIYDSGERLNRLIENFLLFAQIRVIATNPQSLALARRITTNSPGETIRNTTWQVADERDRLADCVVEVGNAPAGISDEYLQKITREIVDNAFKFSPSGSMVTVTSQVEDGHYILSVQDAGRGMDPAQIQAVGAYMQFDRARYEQQGSGLGLAITREIAELYGGCLTIESALDQGTTVRVALPVR
jgi:signal transduction histidine kinase